MILNRILNHRMDCLRKQEQNNKIEEQKIDIKLKVIDENRLIIIDIKYGPTGLSTSNIPIHGQCGGRTEVTEWAKRCGHRQFIQCTAMGRGRTANVKVEKIFNDKQIRHTNDLQTLLSFMNESK